MYIAEFYGEPLDGELNIHSINQKEACSKTSIVRVLTFSSSSIIFVSDLKFPLLESVIYRICVKIHKTDLELFGNITSILKSDQGKASLYELTYILNKRPMLQGELVTHHKRYLQKYHESQAFNKIE
ncbi:hypothetical protein [Bacillus suaedae]|uniref:Uncharacterized protein n=1 Tax=Halalkalibacter suaedae TaxID=2822140 RepID=A0A940WRU3_9BACI|nr:hypothetical protein [Bacillus suaedae]MBP3951529.1 hypothetical protein [Bacillus suaedae]